MDWEEVFVNLAIQTGQILLEIALENPVSELHDGRPGEQSFREDVKYIMDEMKIMGPFLRAAEEKQASNQVERAWVKQIKELSYVVEDFIDEFSRQRESKNLKGQIQSIKARFQEVSERRLRYGIVEMSKSQSSDEYNVAQYDRQLAARFIKDGLLVGIDGPREKLVGWLMDEAESELQLIAVVGGGGLGKTTIVKKAYDYVMSTHFTCQAWITVSQVYHVEGILRDMIKQIITSLREDLDKMGRPELVDKLRSYLQDKRYIIVFDDLWKMDAWKILGSALPRNNHGSRVMLTTRNKAVAEACCSQISGRTYELDKLDDKRSMDLFCRRAFKNTDGTCPKELEKASQDLVKKCDGLPLAIVSIADVLASNQKNTIEECEKLLGQLGLELVRNPNLEGVDRILTLSYNDLPYNVKRCFLYLSRYPKDHLILRKDVQRLWVSEGLVEDRRDMAVEEVAESHFSELEEVAESYFSELVNRFLILPSAFSVDGRVKSFRLHDIILELLVSKSMEENFVTTLGRNVRCRPDDVIQCLSFHSECNPKDAILCHVRSLSMFRDGIRPVSPTLEKLQVLDLYGYSDGDDLLENVGKLLRLRCLMLRHTGVRKLPKSLGNLRNLETLDLRGSDVDKIPSGVTELQQLRVLHGRRSGSRFPRGIGNLRRLQELTGVDLLRSKHRAIEGIGKLTQLRKLGVSDLPRKWEDDFCKSLEAMGDSLRSLEVLGRWGSSHADEPTPFLHNLSAPPPTLRSLHLAPRRNSELPSWVGLLHNAVKITLEGFHLDGPTVEVLGSLPNLMMLNVVCTGTKAHYNLSFGAAEGFRSLKRLSLEFWFEVSLSFREGAMPHLESFDLRYFTWTSLESVGLENLPRLKEIKVMASRDFYGVLEAEIVGHPNHPRMTR